MSLEGPLAQLTEYCACIYRGQLVLVAQQDELGVGGQGIEHRCHQVDGHDGGFVDHQNIYQQRVITVVAESAGIGPAAQQPVQGGDPGGNIRQLHVAG